MIPVLFSAVCQKKNALQALMPGMATGTAWQMIVAVITHYRFAVNHYFRSSDFKKHIYMNLSFRSRVFNLLAATALLAPAANAFENPEMVNPLFGRWDLTVVIDGKELPSWLEVHKSGEHRLVGYYVGTGGSARPISKVNY